MSAGGPRRQVSALAGSIAVGNQPRRGLKGHSASLSAGLGGGSHPANHVPGQSAYCIGRTNRVATGDGSPFGKGLAPTALGRRRLRGPSHRRVICGTGRHCLVLLFR